MKCPGPSTARRWNARKLAHARFLEGDVSFVNGSTAIVAAVVAVVAAIAGGGNYGRNILCE